MSNREKVKAPTVEQLQGGKQVEVQYRNGQKEYVFAKALPERKFALYIELFELGKESELVELACEKEEFWADSLTPESFERLLEEVSRLNSPFITSKFQRIAEKDRWVAELTHGMRMVSEVMRVLEAQKKEGQESSVEIPPVMPLSADKPPKGYKIAAVG